MRHKGRWRGAGTFLLFQPYEVLVMVVCRSRVGVYFYPDFNTVIVGLWEDHLLVQVLCDSSERCGTLIKEYDFLNANADTPCDPGTGVNTCPCLLFRSWLDPEVSRTLLHLSCESPHLTLKVSNHKISSIHSSSKIRFGDLSGPTVSYNPPSHYSLGSPPLLRDPMESVTVEVSRLMHSSKYTKY